VKNIRSTLYQARRRIRKSVTRRWTHLSYYRDYLESRKSPVEPGDVNTVCVLLGPYRNLTSLTASIVFLHPEAQVLNHALLRVSPLPAVNFLDNPQGPVFDNFIRYAVHLSQAGRKEDWDLGGTLTVSHAFTDHPVMQQTYEKRYGDRMLKKEVRCLLWKESMRVSNYLQENSTDLAGLCTKLPRLRFLMPVRNPMDCAVSNLKTGHARHLVDKGSETFEDVLDRIMREIAWFKSYEARMPDRFFSYYQFDFNEAMLKRLAGFLGLAPDPSWIADSMACYDLKASYPHSGERVAAYRRLVDEHFSRLPEARQALLRFAGEPDDDR